MKVKGYIFISFITALIIVLVTLMLLLLASFSYEPVFISYAYGNYVDRSESLIFKNGAGAQLYEGEKATLVDGVVPEENIGASRGECVRFGAVDSIMCYDITFEEDCNIQLIVSVNYYLTDNYSTEASDLFEAVFNGHTLDTQRVVIKNSPNSYNFQENVLCSIECSKGVNELRFISRAKEWAIDYIVLVSEFERELDEPTLENFFSLYDSEAGRQIYQERKTDNKDAFIVENKNASNGYYTYFARKDGYVSFYIQSDKEGPVQLGVALREYGVIDRFFDLCTIYVNGVRYKFDVELLDDQEFEVGTIDFKKGLNEIKISNIAFGFYLDYITLNADISGNS